MGEVCTRGPDNALDGRAVVPGFTGPGSDGSEDRDPRGLAAVSRSRFFQPTITFAREESPVIAALHPVNALSMSRSVVLILRAIGLIREVFTGRHRARACPGGIT